MADVWTNSNWEMQGHLSVAFGYGNLQILALLGTWTNIAETSLRVSRFLVAISAIQQNFPNQ